MVLVLDFGNTQIKTAVFEHNTLLEDRRIFYEKWQNEVEKILALHTKIETIVVASVKNNANFEFLQATKTVNIVFISHDSKFPFTNLYKCRHLSYYCSNEIKLIVIGLFPGALCVCPAGKRRDND